MTEEGRIVDLGTKRVACTPGQLLRYNLVKGDILFNNTNSPDLVGKVAMFQLEGQFVFSNHLTRIRVDRKQMIPEFLHRFLLLLWLTGYFKQQGTQWINQAAINVEALFALAVPVPSLTVQEHIVRILEEAEVLRRLQAASKKRLDDLFQSLLHRAFQGEL